MRNMSFQIYPQFHPICISRRCNGKFVFKKNKDGTFNKTKVICTLCGKTLSFHRSNTSSTRCMRWSARGVKVECAKPPSLNNVGPSLSVPVTSRLALLPNGLQKAVDRLIWLRTRGSPKFCEHQSTAKTHNNDKNPRAV